MDSSTLKCPKCGHPRRLGSEACPDCGIIFEKYVQQEQRQFEALLAQDEKQQRRKRQLLTLGLAGLLATSAIVLFLSGGSGEEDPPASASASAPRSSSAQDYSAYLAQARRIGPTGSAHRSASVFAVDQGVNDATAFFVNNACLALTRLVEPDRHYLGKSSDTSDDHVLRLIDEIRELEEKIGKQRKDFMAKCEDCSEARFQSTTQRLQARLKARQSELKRRQRRDRDPQKMPPDTAITLTIERKRREGRLLESNPTLGLSMITTAENLACVPVEPAEIDSVKPGDEIYLLNGYQKQFRGEVTGLSSSGGGRQLIRYDAKGAPFLNDGGAPAFNKAGKVIGISMPLKNGERFLIPIRDALLAFRIAL